MGDNLSIAHILCSRLCHDIIGPLSAISTGLELLEENLSSQAEEIVSLVKKSAFAANQSLSLIRLVFGENLISQIPSFDQLIDKLRKNIDPAKFQIIADAPTFHPLNDTDRTSLFRAIACLTICATEMAPYGGRMIWSSKDEVVIQLALEGATITLTSEMAESLTNTNLDSTPTPRTVCAYLANHYAKNAHRMIEVSQTDSHVITISLALDSTQA